MRSRNSASASGPRATTAPVKAKAQPHALETAGAIQRLFQLQVAVYFPFAQLSEVDAGLHQRRVMDATDGTIASDNMENGSGIQILELPAGNETIIVESTSTLQNMNPATLTEFTWDQTPHIDAGSFTDTSPTDSFIEVDVADDYLANSIGSCARPRS